MIVKWEDCINQTCCLISVMIITYLLQSNSPKVCYICTRLGSIIASFFLVVKTTMHIFFLHTKYYSHYLASFKAETEFLCPPPPPPPPFNSVDHNDVFKVLNMSTS